MKIVAIYNNGNVSYFPKYEGLLGKFEKNGIDLISQLEEKGKVKIPSEIPGIHGERDLTKALNRALESRGYRLRVQAERKGNWYLVEVA